MASRDHSVRLEGFADLKRAVKAVDKAGAKALQATLKSGAELVADKAGDLAPRGTTPIYPSRKFKTRLADSYRAGTSGNRAVVRSKHPAAKIKEFRKSGTEAQMRQTRPVTRAIEREEGAIADRLAKGFDDLIRRSGWS